MVKFPVKISNKLIRNRLTVDSDCSTNLSSTEIKIIIMLASVIKPEQKEFLLHKISVREFCKFWNVGYGGAQIKSVSKAIAQLASQKFRIDNNIFSWLDSTSKTDNGIMYLKFDDSLSVYLLDLKSNYTKFDINNIIDLKSKDSIYLYLYFKSLVSQGHYNLTLENAYKILGNGRYFTKSEFERNILKKSICEINAKTDINVSWKYVENFGYPEIIRFFIKSKEEHPQRTTVKQPKTACIDIFVDDKEPIFYPLYDRIEFANENELPF